MVEIARRFPGVEESRSYGTPALKVKGKFLARLRSEAEGGLAIQCDFMERETLMQSDAGALLHHRPLRGLRDGADQPRDAVLGRYARNSRARLADGGDTDAGEAIRSIARRATRRLRDDDSEKSVRSSRTQASGIHALLVRQAVPSSICGIP